MRPFTDVLRDHRNGRLVDQLSQRLAKVVEAVEETGKAGAITLKLKIEPNKGEEGAFTVVPSISTSMPENDLPKALFYSDGEGNLLRESPNQRGIFDGDGDTDLGDRPRRVRGGRDD